MVVEHKGCLFRRGSNPPRLHLPQRALSLTLPPSPSSTNLPFSKTLVTCTLIILHRLKEREGWRGLGDNGTFSGYAPSPYLVSV